MQHSRFVLFLIITLLVTLTCAQSAFANKAAVTIEAPASAANSSEITIKVTVTHSADNIFHHVDWFYIMINGKEVERGEYTWNKLPPNATFTREIKYKVQGPMEIKAEAHCNMHGSKGPEVVSVAAK